MQRPQHPLSLFEGLSGVACFLADMAAVLRQEFPDHAFFESERPPRHLPAFPMYEAPFTADIQP